jgi:hypothetical protein
MGFLQNSKITPGTKCSDLENVARRIKTTQMPGLPHSTTRTATSWRSGNEKKQAYSVSDFPDTRRREGQGRATWTQAVSKMGG